MSCLFRSSFYLGHLHIFLAINVTRSNGRRMGWVYSVTEADGKPIDSRESQRGWLGRGKIEDFTWKGCSTSLGSYRVRTLSVAMPGLNTGKPLSPVVVMDPGEPLMAKAPILGQRRQRGRQAGHQEHHHAGIVRSSAWHGPSRRLPLYSGGVIDPDVLWS